MAKYDYAYIAALLSDMRTGDPDSFSAFYAITYPMVYTKAYRTLRNDYAAQDVIQNAYTQAAMEMPLSQSPRKFMRGFLRAVQASIEAEEAKRRIPDELTDILTIDITPPFRKRKPKQKPLRSKEVPPLSEDIANTLLTYILDSCHLEHSTVPLETLAAYGEYRRSRRTLLHVLWALLAVALILVPIVFSAPLVSITENEADWNPSYTVHVNSFMPIQSVIAYVDMDEFSVNRISNTDFLIHPTANGTMVVHVTAKTGRYRTAEIETHHIDTKQPTLLQYHLNDQSLTVQLIDEGISGVDYTSVYLQAPDDAAPISPTSVNEHTGEVVFASPQIGSIIHAADHAGNQLEITIT